MTENSDELGAPPAGDDPDALPEAVVADLRELYLRRPGPAVESQHLAVMLEAAGSPQPATSGHRRLLIAAVALGALGTLTFGGLASAGALPGPIQDAAASVASVAGVQIPRSDDPATPAGEPDEHAPGPSEEGPGRSEDAPGRDGSEPGQSEEAPGRDGSEPGQSEDAPGRGGSEPGKSEEAPGQVKPAPPNPVPPNPPPNPVPPNPPPNPVPPNPPPNPSPPDPPPNPSPPNPSPPNPAPPTPNKPAP